MITSAQALARYGEPQKESGMILWEVPAHLEIGVIPKKIYCNRNMIKPLTSAFEALIQTGYISELKTWDGCFNIRRKKGGGNSMSLHSWGLAIDVNAAWNRFMSPPTLSAGFVKCFTDNGFDWGGNWSVKDGMHFQLATLPEVIFRANEKP